MKKLLLCALLSTLITDNSVASDNDNQPTGYNYDDVICTMPSEEILEAFGQHYALDGLFIGPDNNSSSLHNMVAKSFANKKLSPQGALITWHIIQEGIDIGMSTSKFKTERTAQNIINTVRLSEKKLFALLLSNCRKTSDNSKVNGMEVLKEEGLLTENGGLVSVRRGIHE